MNGAHYGERKMLLMVFVMQKDKKKHLRIMISDPPL
jgi:hypothetical protein